MTQEILYTLTDESPALATYSLFPILSKYLHQGKIEIKLEDISLAARIVSAFPRSGPDKSSIENSLEKLGTIVKNPDANIVKLPNISASIPQLSAAIKELKSLGYNIPDYPSNPKTEEELKIQEIYLKICGSAVNPVLREGNSDRRVSEAVKLFAKKNPHWMGEWSQNSKSVVSHMTSGDFYESEKSLTSNKSQKIRISFIDIDKNEILLKDYFPIEKNEIIDSSTFKIAELKKFIKEQITYTKNHQILFSVHLKATMMKVSDPYMFGCIVEVFYEILFEKFSKEFQTAGIKSSNGFSDILEKINKLPQNVQKNIQNEIEAIHQLNPEMAMVNIEKNISNLYVPNNVIIDASMPAAIRAGGKMLAKDGSYKDTNFIIPDRSYAGIYKTAVEFCKLNGSFDVKTMGSVSNIGLMAKKAEEYGSHDKTFVLEKSGVVKVYNEEHEILFEHPVTSGDIFRMCQTKHESITDWIQLAIEKAKLTGYTTIFWLDSQRAHDREIINVTQKALKENDFKNLNILILDPNDAMQKTMSLIKEGNNVISVTGNVLRDYLTDMFPILELGTSSKMLSIVPLLAGGALFETGAGGTAPLLVHEFMKSNHFIWDSLGEFLALAASLEDIANKHQNRKAKIFAKTLDAATSSYLEHNKSPSTKIGDVDTRGSHYYLAKYWAEELAKQNDDLELKSIFERVASEYAMQHDTIIEQLKESQGHSLDLGGYYLFNIKKVSRIMRPSSIFNKILDQI